MDVGGVCQTGDSGDEGEVGGTVNSNDDDEDVEGSRVFDLKIGTRLATIMPEFSMEGDILRVLV